MRRRESAGTIDLATSAGKIVLEPPQMPFGSIEPG